MARVAAGRTTGLHQDLVVGGVRDGASGDLARVEVVERDRCRREVARGYTAIERHDRCIIEGVARSRVDVVGRDTGGPAASSERVVRAIVVDHRPYGLRLLLVTGVGSTPDVTPNVVDAAVDVRASWCNHNDRGCR